MAGLAATMSIREEFAQKAQHKMSCFLSGFRKMSIDIDEGCATVQLEDGLKFKSGGRAVQGRFICAAIDLV